VAVGQRGLRAGDVAGVDGAVAARPDGVAVAERVQHRAGRLHRGALAHGRGVGADLGVVGQVAVAEVGPLRRLPDEVDLGVGLRPPHPVDPRLRLDVEERRERRSLVSHHARRAVGVGDDRLDAEVPEQPHCRPDGVAARVVDVRLDAVDARVGPDALDLEARDGDGDRLRRHREHDGALGLDVVEAGEVLDAGRADPGGGVGVGLGEPVPDRRQPGRELLVGDACGHTPDSARRGKSVQSGRQANRSSRSPDSATSVSARFTSSRTMNSS